MPTTASSEESSGGATAPPPAPFRPRAHAPRHGAKKIPTYQAPGILWFFDPDNWEMLVKVLDGCGVNHRFWVFAAATTNGELTLRVTDTTSGEQRSYFNPLGNASAAIIDTDAFAACP